MSKTNFTPVVGMITEDSYLHGAGDKNYVGLKSKIEAVGIDWFVARVFFYETVFIVSKKITGVLTKTILNNLSYDNINIVTKFIFNFISSSGFWYYCNFN